MIIYLLLFLAAIAGGLAAYFLPKYSPGNYKLTLVFSGAYLFAITITELLPDIFSDSSILPAAGLWVLAGFFIQQLLEFLSQGVEHGHIHVHKHGEAHHSASAVWVMTALSFHATMEGGMLAEPQITEGAISGTLVSGILLHKFPEAFALMSVLICELRRSQAIVLLLIFSLASPAGLALGSLMFSAGWLNESLFYALFAVVSGGFLHISTTIVFESSADHNFNAKKTAVAILGSGIAVLLNLFF